MFAWTISLVQILAILACPLTCVSGNACCGAEYFQAASQITASANLEALQSQELKCNCCCDTEAQQEQDGSPAAPTSQTECQGVCGGAILEKSCELPVETNLTSLPPVIVGATVLSASAAQVVDDTLWLCCSGNYGRSLRTLHESFLC